MPADLHSGDGGRHCPTADIPTGLGIRARRRLRSCTSTDSTRFHLHWVAPVATFDLGYVFAGIVINKDYLLRAAVTTGPSSPSQWP